jgi:hypothetical protein
MGRLKGSKNKAVSKISYPRKCMHCDYMSNNPTMYHYHNKIHETIPQKKLCDHGCGQFAVYINTNGKYTCAIVAHQCPAYTKKLSTQVKSHWQRPNSVNRKEKTREKFIEYCRDNHIAQEKRKKTLKEKWGDFTPEQMKEYRHYARRIRARAQKWYKSKGIVLGRQLYHVDHKLSIWDAWNLGLSETIVNHPVNLQILEAKLNESKGRNSLLTLDELLKLIKEYKD